MKWLLLPAGAAYINLNWFTPEDRAVFLWNYENSKVGFRFMLGWVFRDHDDLGAEFFLAPNENLNTAQVLRCTTLFNFWPFNKHVCFIPTPFIAGKGLMSNVFFLWIKNRVTLVVGLVLQDVLVIHDVNLQSCLWK